ncbi:MAG TPA: pyridoxal-dependent decarboxylase [Fimbriimonadaceae bacterium]|nr:pyridoxal-dependent decarboxylase [Fimbriimonadaceae bacterium]
MSDGLSAWFAGPKAENAEWFEARLDRIVQDYYAWRRNYFPEDGVVVDSRSRREGEAFRDAFDDRLLELLARLKADFPFQSPRYAAHMLAEQTLPSIAGYFAAMLYNPNNVTREVAPVTNRLELEACRMIGEMLGYGPTSWGHLTSGGTIANLEALWVARTVAYLPDAIVETRASLGLDHVPTPGSPSKVLEAFAAVFTDAERTRGIGSRSVVAEYLRSTWCVPERGLAAVAAQDGRRPVLLVPETHHYCFDKAVDILGVGRQGIVSIGVDRHFRMEVSDLEAHLERLDREQARVIAVVAIIGTTEEGAIDPIDQIVALRRRRESAGLASFWLHADAAYGGYLRTMTRPARIGLGDPFVDAKIAGEMRRVPLDLPNHDACDALDELGQADSIAIDPHKLGYVPYPAGAVCFRSDLVKPLLRQEAPYLEDEAADPEAERRTEGIGVYILEGSKPGAAAAGVWLSHTLIPLDSDGLGRLIRQTVRNATELHALLTSYPEWRPGSVVAVPLTRPGSNIVCFAFRPSAGGASLSEINALNRAVYARFTVSETSSHRVYDQEFFVSRTTLSPRQYRTHAVAPFLEALGVSGDAFAEDGVFLLRCVLMNPWYDAARERGRYFLAELVEALYASAEDLIRSSKAQSSL